MRRFVTARVILLLFVPKAKKVELLSEWWSNVKLADGRQKTKTGESTMSESELIHIIPTYRLGKAEITASYAVSAEIRQQLELWERGENSPSAKDLADWLEKHGGKLDRQDGPAYIMHVAGCFTFEQYYRDGKLDRQDGPADVMRFANGSMSEGYWRGGEFVRKEQRDPLLIIPGVMIQRGSLLPTRSTEGRAPTSDPLDSLVP